MSIKKNYLYNLVKVMNQLIFPMLTIPYISRVLGVKGIGTVEYFVAISSYGLMISGFGLSQYASIEIAKLKNKNDSLKEKVKQAFNFQLLMTILGSLVFIVISLFLGITDKLMIGIFFIKILFNLFRVEWYYTGSENFKYITIRDLFVKVVFLVLIFTFVKNPSDIYIYSLALVLGDGIANLFNIRKMIIDLKLSPLKLLLFNKKDIIGIYRKTLPFFFAGVSSSIYLTLDKIMVGRIAGESYVGYYSMSSRLIRIAMGVAVALATAITPRLAYYYQNEKEEYFKLLKKSTNFILMLTFPMFIAILIMSENIILLVFGKEFLPAIPTLKILSLILVIVPFANILGLQVLNVTGNAKKYTVSIFSAAIINALLNSTLIYKFKHNGAAVASVIAELIGILIQAYFVNKCFELKNIFERKIIKYFYSSLIMGLLVYLIGTLKFDFKLTIVIQIAIGITIYFLSLIMFRERIILETVEKLKRRF